METIKDREVMIGLWRTNNKKFCVSHNAGLTEEQIELFKSFKVGDRVKLWINEGNTTKAQPDFRLGKLQEMKSAL